MWVVNSIHLDGGVDVDLGFYPSSEFRFILIIGNGWVISGMGIWRVSTFDSPVIHTLAPCKPSMATLYHHLPNSDKGMND